MSQTPKHITQIIIGETFENGVSYMRQYSDGTTDIEIKTRDERTGVITTTNLEVIGIVRTTITKACDAITDMLNATITFLNNLSDSLNNEDDTNA